MRASPVPPLAQSAAAHYVANDGGRNGNCFGKASKSSTEVIFNSSHPAHKSLLMTLDSDTKDATDKDLVLRIGNASDTLKMLFAAWVRQEVEDVKNREKLVRFRQETDGPRLPHRWRW